MKKIKGFVNKNYKVVIGIIIGITISIGIGVSAVATKDITYDNSKSGLTSTNLQGAIDELNEKAKKINHCAEISGNAVKFKVGDYVQMTPRSTSYTTDTSMTGYTSTQTIYPSELKLWRVIRINSDNTVDMVSEYVSSVDVYFEGKTGYQNYVGYLNTIAHQYENSCYTIESRYMGYDGTQTPYITDTSALNLTSAPQTSDTSNSNVTSATEVKGLGDIGYKTDYNLVNTALGTLVANKVGTTTAKAYWLASRHYSYFHDHAYDDVYNTYWTFRGRYIYTSGSLDNRYLYSYGSGPLIGCTGCPRSDSYGAAVRPIVTLKSGVKASSGDGSSSSSPYVLP